VLNQHKSPQSKASEIESAIKHHIKLRYDDDPEYYQKLSERLEELIRQNEEKWDELVQLLLNLRDNIETDRQKKASDLGLSSTELSFYNILLAELGGEEKVNKNRANEAKQVVQSLVQMLEDATQIVDFFQKWDEQKRVKREIKRTIIQHFDESLVPPVVERFMELARVKFR